MGAQAMPADVRPTLGTAIGSLVAGVAALCLAWMPPLGMALGAVAVVSGLLARRELRRNDAVRGSRLSLAGFLLGSAVLAFGAVLTLLPPVMALLFLVRV